MRLLLRPLDVGMAASQRLGRLERRSRRRAHRFRAEGRGRFHTVLVGRQWVRPTDKPCRRIDPQRARRQPRRFGDRRRRPWRAPARQAPRDCHGGASALAPDTGKSDGRVMAAIELRDVRKSFQSLEVIHGIDLAVDEGAFTVFVGPSGCGKSTLLRMIAGLEEVSSGEVHIDGKRCDHLLPSARGMAMVFQSYALYPHMNVEQNLRFGLENLRTPRPEIDKRVARAAGILQIEHLMKRRPNQLSGGQSQRVAIGRAIVKEPRAFLFDEPLSNLDAELRVKMRGELVALHRRLKSTMIYVTHDQVEAMTMADQIVVLREGVVEQVGSPVELYARPANRFVAGFLGAPQMNFVGAKVGREAGIL